MPVADHIRLPEIAEDDGSYIIEATDLLSNDNDFQGDALTITAVENVIGGSAQLTSGGNIQFTPDPDFIGMPSFSYRIKDVDGHLGITIRYRNSDGDKKTELTGKVTLEGSGLPDDPMFADQWYLHNTNIPAVWADYTGDGVKVGVFEVPETFQGTLPEHSRGSGVMDFDHSDLDPNADDDFHKNRQQPENYSRHATHVAGIIGAARDGKGIVGAAYDSDLYSLEVSSENQGILKSMLSYDVVNHSWGSEKPLSNNFFNLIDEASQFEDAVRDGRDGLGTAIVFAAGNARQKGDRSDLRSHQSSRFATNVAAINHQGDLGSLQPGTQQFSDPGASLLVAAPGSNILSTSVALSNDEGDVLNNGFDSGQGTSYAAPVVSGIIALMLEANPKLGYRDIQEILAMSARKVDDPNTSWSENGAGNWNGGGMHSSHDYGFGNVDAKAAVRLAETWTELDSRHNESSVAATSGPLELALPDHGAVSSTLHLDEAIHIEHVEITLDFDHQQLGDLRLVLTGPDGMESILMDRTGVGPDSTAPRGEGETSAKYRFTTTNHWGSSAEGDWTITITDAVGGAVGVLHDWSITAHGQSVADAMNDSYIYTSEFSEIVDEQRRILRDTDGGNDSLNASAINGDSVINLAAGATSMIDGQSLTIAEDTTIEMAFGGDGHDLIHGNQADNLLSGGRGNDVLTGGAGDDMLVAGPGHDILHGDGGTDQFVVRKSANAVTEIMDFDPANEQLTLSGFTTFDRFDELIISDEMSGAHIKLPGDQVVIVSGVSSADLTAKNIILTEAWTATPDLPEQYGSGATDYRGTVGDDFYKTQHDQDQKISGKAGNDRLEGGVGNDVLRGDTGDDYLEGNVGDDLLDGGVGNDQLFGDAGNDSLDGGVGDDYLEGNAGNDSLDGGAGNDQLFGDAGNDSLDGGVGDDYLEGNAGNDSLDGGAGNDELQGDIGDDILIGGAGDDWLQGEEGSDQLFGGAGDDQLLGGAGNDQLQGGAGDDQVQGGSGNDTLKGGVGNDELMGRDGTDILYGELGDDQLFGDEGNDQLFGGAGADQLQGGAGDDQLQGGAHDDQLHGGEGSDILSGGTEGDILFGGAGGDQLFGDEGNDQLFGGGDDDQLQGGAGDDILKGGVGSDNIIGGSGSDVAHYEGISSDYWFWKDDKGNLSITHKITNDKDILQSVERLFFEESGEVLLSEDLVLTLRATNDRPNIKGSDWGNHILGSEQANNLVGGHGNDIIFGAEGDDALLGGSGNDNLKGDIGNDILFGENGDDQLDGGTGDDQLQGGSGNDILDGHDGADILFGQSGDDILRGGNGNDGLQGGVGNDHLLGGDGNDRLFSEAGNDFLDGGTGSDLLVAGDGNDHVLGSAGADQLLGGEGIDHLDYSSSNAGIDVNLNMSRGLGGIAEGDYIVGFENLTGSAFADQLTGDLGDNILKGGAGDDILNGGAGSDDLDGGDGIDRVRFDNSISNYDISWDGATLKVVDGNDINRLTHIEAIDFADISFTIPADGNFNPIGAADQFDAGNYRPFTIPAHHLLANDRDIDGDAFHISAVESVIGGDVSLTASGDILFQAETGFIGDAEFRYQVTDQRGGSQWIEVTGHISDRLELTGSGKIQGSAADESLTGSLQADILYGRGGDDVMSGGDGSDKFVIAAGADDHTTILDFDPNNPAERLILQGFEAGSSFLDLVITQQGADAVISLSGEQKIILEHCDSTILTADHIEFVGWDWQPPVIGTSADDILIVDEKSSVIKGGEGQDTAEFDGNFADYDVQWHGNDLLVSRRGHTTRFVGIERLAFADQTLIIGAGQNLLPIAQNDDLGRHLSDGTSIHISPADLLSNDYDPEQGNLTLIDIEAVTGGTVIYDGQDTITFTPNADFLGEARLSYIIEDDQGGRATAIATMTLQDSLPVITGGYQVIGSVADEHLIGGDSGNLIIGDSSFQNLNGKGGNDILDGGAGDDSIFGDTVYADADAEGGDDILKGGDGDDTLYGDAQLGDIKGGNDILDGGIGNDELYGDGGDGDGGDDNLFGGEGDDILYGDSLFSDGIAGHDQLDGGGGNDILYGDSFSPDGIAGHDRLDGGAGNDTLYGDSYFLNAYSGNDILYGGAGDDKLYGDSYFEGDHGGDDTLYGGAGDDNLEGGNGNDFLDGGTGIDHIDGGTGADTIILTERGDEGYAGRDEDQDHFILNTSGDHDSEGIGNFVKIHEFDPERDILDFRELPDIYGLEDLEIITDYQGILIGSSEQKAWYHLSRVKAEDLTESNTLFAEGSSEKPSEPSFVADEVSLAEDQTGFVSLADLLANDSDVMLEGAVITSVEGGGEEGNWSFSPGGITFKPATNFNGVAETIYTVAFAGQIYQIPIKMIVAAVNDTPILLQAPNLINVTEGQILDVQLPADMFHDPDGDSLAISLSGPNGTALPGWLSFDPNTGRLTWTPGSDDIGQMVLSITAQDQYGASVSTALPVDIHDFDEAPIGETDQIKIAMDQPNLIPAAQLLANDHDPDGTFLTITSVQEVNHGQVVLTDDGDVLFTPEAGFTGQASFVYTLADKSGQSVDVNVSLDVEASSLLQGSKEADNLIANEYVTKIIAKSGDDTIIVETDNDVIIDPGAGDDQIHAGDTGSQTVQYAENKDRYHIRHDGQAITVTDRFGEDGTDYLTGVDVLRFGDQMDIQADDIRNQIKAVGNEVSIEGTSWQDDIQGSSRDDTFLESGGQDYIDGRSGLDQMIFKGSVHQYHMDFEAGGLRVTRQGGDGETVLLKDIERLVFDDWVINTNQLIEVDGNILPMAKSFTHSVAEDNGLILDPSELTAGFLDPDSDQVPIISNIRLKENNPQQGHASLLPDGRIQLIPADDVNGDISFIYTITDSQGGQTEAEIILNVIPVQDAPDAEDDLVNWEQGRDLAIPFSDLLRNDKDRDGNIITLVSALAVVGGSIEVSANEHVIFRPDEGFVGEARFSYTIEDSFGYQSSATVFINVAATGDLVLVGTPDDDSLVGGLGFDQLSGAGGNDSLDGGKSADHLDGGSGNDYLKGGSGDDYLIGGTGDDHLDGGSHNDILEGGTGHDTLIGGRGHDTLRGGAGVDHLMGGLGEDLLEGGQGDDILGGSGDAGAGDDRLYGNDGHDQLIGGDGADQLNGGIGDDILEGGRHGDILAGGAGEDTASYINSSAGVAVDLGLGNAIGGDAEGDLLSEIENLTGSDHRDVLTGDSGNNRLEGGRGDDYLNGGSGADILIGGQGSDHLDGGAGEDTAILSGNLDDYIMTKEENGTVRITDLRDGHPEGVKILQNIENITFVAEGATYDLQGLLSEAQSGTDGDDSLKGDDANNVLIGQDGNDTIVGGAGDDVLVGDTDQVQQLKLTATFEYEQAGYRNAVGWYNKLTGKAGFLWTHIDWSVTETGDQVETYAEAMDISEIEFFILPNGYNRNKALMNSHTKQELDAELRVDLENMAVYFGDIKLKGTGNPAYFSDNNLNADGRDHVKDSPHGSFAETIPGRLAWEDLPNLGDADFDDVVMKIEVGGGMAGDDVLEGGAGNDVLFGGAGDDYLNGGDDIDTARYVGRQEDYILTRDENNVVTVTHRRGREGSDKLVNIEKLVFDMDGSVLDVTDIGLTVTGEADTADHIIGSDQDDLLLGESSRPTLKLEAIFTDSHAGYRNALGWYDRTSGQAGLLFAEDNLNPGDSVVVDVPAVGIDEIGFFLVPDGLRENQALFAGHSISEISDGLRIDLVGGVVYFNDAELSGKKNPAYFSDIKLNGDGQEHIVSGKGIVHFEENSHPKHGASIPDITISVDFASNNISGTFDDNDILEGGAGDDVLIGGLGDDLLIGGSGTDRYDLGWGLDRINNYDASSDPDIDILTFTNGEAAEDLWFKQSGEDLVINRLGTGSDQISGAVVENWFSANAEAYQHLKVEAGGETLNVSDINHLVEAMAAFETDNPGFDPVTSQLTGGSVVEIDMLVSIDTHWKS